MRSATSDAKSHRSVRGGVNGRSTTRIHKSDETDILSRQAQHVIEVAPIPSIGGVRATTNPRKKIQQRSSAVRWLTLALLTMPPTYQHSGVPRTAMARVTWGAAAADGGDVGVGDCEDEEAASCTAGGGDGDDDEVLALGRGVLDWVRSQGARGGRVHDLVEVRRVPVPPPRRMGRRSTPTTTDDEEEIAADTILGIFATGRIEEGEIICSIPRGMYVGPTRNGRASNDVESTEDWCQVIRDTALQMKLGAASDLAPYARYLAAQPRGVVPAFWSDAGRNLLGIVLGDHLPPRDVGDDVEGLEACDVKTQNGIGDDEDQDLLRHAAELVIARSEDLHMTPVFDMINHREGRWCNTYMTLPEYSPTSSFVVKARRTIEAGEQLHVTYSMCELYGGGRRSDGTTGEEGPRKGRGFSARVSDRSYPGCGYDTSDILHDFGFVEQTPQRWIIGRDDDHTEEEVRFDLLDDSDDGVTLSWLRDGGPPSEDMVRFLRSELDRLDVVFVEATRQQQSLQRRGRKSRRDEVDFTGGDGDCDTNSSSDVGVVPKSEWDVIRRYHEALTYALGRAVAAAEEALET